MGLLRPRAGRRRPGAPSAFLHLEEEERKEGWFRTAHGVNLVITAAGLDDLDARLADARAALLNWKRRRGETCRRLNLVVAVDPLHQLEALDRLQKLYAGDPELRPFLERLDASVTLADRQGRVIHEYAWAEAGPPLPRARPRRKPRRPRRHRARTRGESID